MGRGREGLEEEGSRGKGQCAEAGENVGTGEGRLDFDICSVPPPEFLVTPLRQHVAVALALEFVALALTLASVIVALVLALTLRVARRGRN